MNEVRFAEGYPLAKYRLYTLCCHKLLSSYEELSKACNKIDALVEQFDDELQKSYVGDNYELGVRGADLLLRRLINQHSLNVDAQEKLAAIHEAMLADKHNWDPRLPLIEFRDIGKKLAQDFYCEGQRATNLELMDSKAPGLVFSNLCISEEESPCRFCKHQPGIMPRPIGFLSGEIHLPFTKEFKFCCYLSYPVLFFHEYVSHVYVPRIDSRKFDDGWLMFAIVHFLGSRWKDLCRKHPLIYAQFNVLENVWKPCFTRLAKDGYELGESVMMWIADNDRFLQFTWDLASYPYDLAGYGSFHDDFIDVIEKFTSHSRGHLLHSAAKKSANALELYWNLKANL